VAHLQALELVRISINRGDAKSLITHPGGAHGTGCPTALFAFTANQ
jgi:hypothetical protein